jgi:GalNAc-alpha-(1->4)-GalNAc-alpha-(1->3)-diNAcBac-PP-undecaprenol alpha-1,4-N-acetyl-D-galactosaminyltransferase
MSIMANYWAARGKQVTLITFASEEIDFYPLHPEVKRVALGLMTTSRHPWEALRNNLRRLKRLRQEIRKSEPEVVISFMDPTNVLTLLASVGLNTPVIVSLRTDPRQYRIGWARSALRRLLYPQASAVVVQTEEIRCWTQRFVRQEAVFTIPNPIMPPLYDEPDRALHSGYTVAAMGSLLPEKGFDLLLRAFARCTAKYPGWSLVIIGEGRERETLETLVGELGIADRVSMPGRIREPVSLLRGVDLFVMSSRVEGFPNALLEAMACGLPVVSFDCPSGPRNIIRQGVDGVLVKPEDVEALAAAMQRLMGDDAERERLGSRAVEVTERFSLERVMGIWEDILGRVIEKRRA